jgi:hypothetical protein
VCKEAIAALGVEDCLAFDDRPRRAVVTVREPSASATAPGGRPRRRDTVATAEGELSNEAILLMFKNAGQIIPQSLRACLESKIILKFFWNKRAANNGLLLGANIYVIFK